MRIVLDTNVLARTTPGLSSAAREVLRLAVISPHVLLLSENMLAELDRVLRYDRLRKLHGLSDDEIDRHVADIRAVCVLVPLPAGPLPSVVTFDPDDDMVIATAMLGKADVICTRDHHLLHADVVAYCRAHAIEILRDVDLLAILRADEPGNP